MVVSRGSVGYDRTIGPLMRSNRERAIFALTFAAIDIIVTTSVESIFLGSAASVPLCCSESGGNCLTIFRGGIHERGVSREQIDAWSQLSNCHDYLRRAVDGRMCHGREIRCGKGAQPEFPSSSCPGRKANR